MSHPEEFTGNLVAQYLELWMERAEREVDPLKLSNENLEVPFPFLNSLVLEIAKCKPQFLDN